MAPRNAILLLVQVALAAQMIFAPMAAHAGTTGDAAPAPTQTAQKQNYLTATQMLAHKIRTAPAGSPIYLGDCTHGDHETREAVFSVEVLTALKDHGTKTLNIEFPPEVQGLFDRLQAKPDDTAAREQFLRGMVDTYAFGHAQTPQDTEKFYQAYADLAILAAKIGIRIRCKDDMTLEKAATTVGQGIKATPALVRILDSIKAEAAPHLRDTKTAASYKEACAFQFNNIKAKNDATKRVYDSLSPEDQKVYDKYEKTMMENFQEARDNNVNRIAETPEDSYYFGVIHADRSNRKSIVILFQKKVGKEVYTIAVLPPFDG